VTVPADAEVSSVEDRIRAVLANVFGLDPCDVGPDTSKDTVRGWDSLQHLAVVLALEEEFELEFDDSETVDLVNLPLITTIVSERLTGRFRR
jgi:acyl carrier protein